MRLSDIYKEIMIEKNASVAVVDENEIVKQAEAEVTALEKLAGELYVIGQDFARLHSGLPKLAEDKELKDLKKVEKDEKKVEKDEKKEDKDVKKVDKDEHKEEKDEHKEKEDVKKAIKDEMKKSAEYKEYLIKKYCE